MTITDIVITDKAIAFFQKLLEKSGIAGESRGIRIGIKRGGCSGFQYVIEPVQNHDKYDNLKRFRNVNFYIDPKSMVILIGTEIDCEVVNLVEQIIFKNPRAKSSCGCGISFELK